jgi:hypothetical protein
LGTVWIPIPETILSKEEVEIADDFAFDYEDVNTYIIHIHF